MHTTNILHPLFENPFLLHDDALQHKLQSAEDIVNTWPPTVPVTLDFPSVDDTLAPLRAVKRTCVAARSRSPPRARAPPPAPRAPARASRSREVGSPRRAFRFQPSLIRRKRKHGFLKRLEDRHGRNILKRRRAKNRKRLSC